MTAIMVIGDMKGRAALVTGAASGLGKASAIMLAKAGADMCLVDIHKARLAETEAEIAALGGKVISVCIDLADAKDCKSAVRSAVKEFGRLDALCHVAGLIRFANTPEMPEEQWHMTLNVNLAAAFFLAQEAIPHLLEQDGAIVNVASSAAFIGEAYAAAYCASKAGMIGMTKAMAMEYMYQPIRINAVAPGGMHTNIAENLTFPAGFNRSLIDRFAGLRGLVEVDDVAQVIAHLASPAGRGFHGNCVTIDRGVTAG